MRYRCFCMTKDGRIITGAFVEARSDAEAVSAADRLWQHVSGFHHLEVWLGDALLHSVSKASPIQNHLDVAALQRSSRIRGKSTVMHVRARTCMYAENAPLSPTTGDTRSAERQSGMFRLDGSGTVNDFPGRIGQFPRAIPLSGRPLPGARRRRPHVPRGDSA